MSNRATYSMVRYGIVCYLCSNGEVHADGGFSGRSIVSTGGERYMTALRKENHLAERGKIGKRKGRRNWKISSFTREEKKE
jgi:hypothetical protein